LARRADLSVDARLRSDAYPRNFEGFDMAKALTLADLPEDIARVAQAQIAADRLASVEDFIRAGAAALESAQRRHDEKLTKLRTAIDEGDASGVAEASSLEGILRDIRARRDRSPAIP
jgi:Arc/MetJ-type ribon-helix-helix transcriptional regulator